jgi:hypothetical protein
LRYFITNNHLKYQEGLDAVILMSEHPSIQGASRLATVSDGTNMATNTYLANSPLVGQIYPVR